MTDEVIERVERLDVLGMSMRVMTLEDLLVTKLLALDEHSADYETLIGIARALREQVDWSAVRARTDDSPFARAFFVILEGLGIMESAGAERAAGTRIKVGPGLAALEGGRDS